MFFCKTWKKVLIAATMVVALCAPQAHASIRYVFTYQLSTFHDTEL